MLDEGACADEEENGRCYWEWRTENVINGICISPSEEDSEYCKMLDEGACAYEWEKDCEWEWRTENVKRGICKIKEGCGGINAIMKKENCVSRKCKFVENEGYGYCTCEGKNSEECEEGEDNNCKWIYVGYCIENSSFSSDESSSSSSSSEDSSSSSSEDSSSSSEDKKRTVKE